MSKRTQDELSAHPCFFKLKDFDVPSTSQQVEKIKQIVPKLDAAGTPVMKEIEVTVKKSCGCKNKDGTPQMQTVKQLVPDTMEVLVDAPAQTAEDNKKVLCKLFGTVRRSHCEGCHTYKVKPQ